jgi:hypothetical protein
MSDEKYLISRHLSLSFVRIAIDIRWIRPQEIDGIGRYVTNLTTYLTKLNTNHEYFLITHPDIPASPHLHIPMSLAPVSYPLFSLQDLLGLPAFLNNLGIDLFHVPNYLTSPLTGHYTKIITVHDLIPYLYPKTLWRASLKWKLYYKSKYPTALVLQKADHIIADSAHTKKDIMQLFGIAEERITVIWPGVETRFFEIERPSTAFLRKYNIDSDFLLYLGRQDPYKGLELLIRAYYQLDPGLRKQYKLVIAGKKDKRYLEPVEQLIDCLSLKEQVQFLGYVPDADLPLLYKAATLFTYPSLYEGFGFPPLEAMACGTPVIYSRGSSLEEVIGENAWSFTPNQVLDLVQSIQTLLYDNRVRKEVSEKGRKYALSLTWERTAEAVLGVYNKVGRKR